MIGRAFALIESVWALLGPADLGPVDFPTLARRRTPNDALAAPPDLCAKARPDVTSPEFPVSAERLRGIVEAVAASEGTVTPAEGGDGRHLRFVARTAFMRFPDTVDVLILPRGEGRSTIAIYSRSQLGQSDLGVNGRRVRRWLKAIAERAAAQP